MGKKYRKCKTQVKIGAHPYEVRTRSRVRNSDGIPNAGHIDAQRNRIDIDYHQTGSQLEEAVIHEITHGISFDRALGLTEEQVQTLSAGWLAVLKDNPHLFQVTILEA